jgi:hypothetical protein
MRLSAHPAQTPHRSRTALEPLRCRLPLDSHVCSSVWNCEGKLPPNLRANGGRLTRSSTRTPNACLPIHPSFDRQISPSTRPPSVVRPRRRNGDGVDGAPTGIDVPGWSSSQPIRGRTIARQAPRGAVHGQVHQQSVVCRGRRARHRRECFLASIASTKAASSSSPGRSGARRS